jgi:hypothetical protein
MNYQFDTEDAVTHGLPEAVLLHHLRYWVRTNKANEKNEFETEINGKKERRTWTYNSIRAFTVLFPFWKKGQIERILTKLTKQNVILKGNFNRTEYDRTSWYAFVDESFLKDTVPISRNREMDSPKSGNRNAEIGKPIPDRNTDIKTKDENFSFFENLSLNKDQEKKLFTLYRRKDIEENAEKYSTWKTKTKKKYRTDFAGILDFLKRNKIERKDKCSYCGLLEGRHKKSCYYSPEYEQKKQKEREEFTQIKAIKKAVHEKKESASPPEEQKRTERAEETPEERDRRIEKQKKKLAKQAEIILAQETVST